MYHPTTRVLTVLELLQAHGQLSGTELAARLEVDRRTIRRYVVMLQDMGVPIEADMGRHGGYRLRPGYKLPPLMFTNEEALAVVLGLMATRRLGLGATAFSVDGALAKIERVLPDTLQERAQAIQHVLILNLPPPREQIQADILSTISAGVHQNRQVLIVYRTGKEVTERSLDPYGLVYHDQRWYAAGYCHLRKAIRVFRLDRVQRAELRDVTFNPPADFDSLSYVLDSFVNIPDRWDIEVILKATVEEVSGKIPRGLGSVEDHPQGVLFRTAVGDLDWMARFLIGLACPIVICHPPLLRIAFRELAAQISRFAEE